MSLSARRAWIEIPQATVHTWKKVSLSARRAWIEIVKLFRQNYECFVALRKESVDRNHSFTRRCLMSVGRSPQGERG